MAGKLSLIISIQNKSEQTNLKSVVQLATLTSMFTESQAITLSSDKIYTE